MAVKLEGARELSSVLNDPKGRGTGPSTVGTPSNGKEVFFPKCIFLLAKNVSCCFLVLFCFGEGVICKPLLSPIFK